MAELVFYSDESSSSSSVEICFSDLGEAYYAPLLFVSWESL